MRLAGNQQHAQPVPHPGNRHHRARIAVADGSGQRVGGEFHHALPGTGDGDVDVLFLADGHGDPSRRLAVMADGQRGGATAEQAGLAAQILHHRPQRHILADNAIAGGGDHAHAPIRLFALGGEQHVQWHAVGHVGRNVMHLPVGCHDHAREAGGLDVREGVIDGTEQPGAVIVTARDIDHAQFQIAQCGVMAGHILGDGIACAVHQGAAVAQLHRGGAVEHQQCDIRPPLPRLLNQSRPGEPEQHRGESQRPPQRARCASPDRKGEHQRAERGEADQQPVGQQRGEVQGGDAVGHWPRRSSNAGTCT